eukprot:g50008.t1
MWSGTVGSTTDNVPNTATSDASPRGAGRSVVQGGSARPCALPLETFAGLRSSLGHSTADSSQRPRKRARPHMR